VFSISFNYFLFDAYSTLGFDELIEDINTNGITGRNYRSLGALVRSESLNINVINLFNDVHIKSCLSRVLDEMDELLQFSDIKLDYRIVRIYTDILSLQLDTKEEIINGVTFKYLLLKPIYIDMIYQKTLSRLIMNRNDEFIFLILEDEDVVEFKTVCSPNLIDRGMNCRFITDLIVKLSCEYVSFEGNGGGGELTHAGFRASSNLLKDNYYEESLRLVIEYLESFDKDFKIFIVK
jgi:hypothetical protein